MSGFFDVNFFGVCVCVCVCVFFCSNGFVFVDVFKDLRSHGINHHPKSQTFGIIFVASLFPSMLFLFFSFFVRKLN